jgi:hypothetical protein
MGAIHSPAIIVGGRVVGNPADAILQYLEQHGGTVTHFDVGQKRPSQGQFKTLYWEAVRRDILGGEAGLRVLREVLAVAEAPLATEAARRLSDVRLLDMLAFAA